MNELAIQNIAHTMGTLKDTMSSLEIAVFDNCGGCNAEIRWDA